MRPIKGTLLFICLGFVYLNPLILKAQNPVYRQAYGQRHLTNPALIGTGQINNQATARISSGTKAQWFALGKRLFTQSVSIDSKIGESNAAFQFGAFATDYLSGSENRSKYSHFSINSGYAYDLKLGNDWYLSAGLSLQFSSFTFGKDQFFWEDQINAANTGFVKPTQEPTSLLTKNVFHASAGGMLYGKNGFLGVSVMNINQPDISFFEEGGQNIPMNISIQAGWKVFTSPSDFEIIPSAMYQIQSDLQSRSIMLNGRKNNFRMGLGVQNTQQLNQQAFSLNYYFGGRYDIYYVGYSNDWNFSVNNAALPLTHEFTVLIFPYSTKGEKRPNPFPEY